MTKTGKKLSGITVIKTRRGAGADARARWEGKAGKPDRVLQNGAAGTRYIKPYRGLLTRKSGNYLIT